MWTQRIGTATGRRVTLANPMQKENTSQEEQRSPISRVFTQDSRIFLILTIWYSAAYPLGGSGEWGMFVDLVKGIQVGTDELGFAEGWPMADGNAYPLGTPENVNIAQNHPGENAWDGYELLNLPNSQMNRSAVTGTIGQVGSIYDQKRAFIVTAEDIMNALVAQGKDPNTVDSFYIYFELHLARTSIFSRSSESLCQWRTCRLGRLYL